MIKYQNGYKYRLYEDATLKLPESFAGYGFTAKWGKLDNCLLTLFEGYAWDGCSGPTYDDKSNMQGGLGHDGLYQAMREGLLPRTLKPAADDFLRQQCKEDGMAAIRVWYYHKGVDKFGLEATIRNKDILVAP